MEANQKAGFQVPDHCILVTLIQARQVLDDLLADKIRHIPNSTLFMMYYNGVYDVKTARHLQPVPNETRA